MRMQLLHNEYISTWWRAAMRQMRLSIRLALWTVGITVLMMGWAGRTFADSGSVTVFAAASTTNAVTEVGRIFMERNPERFVTSFASSSTLAKQIENGAPADVFISANRKWMDYLEEKRLVEKETRLDLLGNRIVLIVPADSPVNDVRITPDFDLAGLVADGHMSMGDPDHVPAGIYGRQALESLGVWTSVESRVARSKDVRAALALVERGEAPVGLVYATDAAISDKVRVAGIFPEDSHPPIVYPVAVVSEKRTPATDRFMELLRSPEARSVFEKYGFTVR
ncbi:MAG: molybdate ABC transporter substrate-binding protein [Desulfobacterales bacterium]